MQQFRDERFEKVLAALKYKATGPWVLALPREDLDPTSKAVATGHVTYKLNAKENQVAVMHVVSTGPGRCRLGYREHIPVSVGDLCLVNLREAGHWMALGFPWGRENFYLFTGDVPFARMYRTEKRDQPLTEAEFAELPNLHPEATYAGYRSAYADQWFWNIRDVLSDYVVLGRDSKAETHMRNGPGTLLHIPGTAQTDGTRSDNMRDSRFPIVYRRVLGVGPGKWLTRESDLGVVEREETKSEARPGDMMAMCKSVQAASFTFQGAPLEVIHAASVLVVEHSAELATEVHESVPKPLTWDEPSDEEEEDPDPPPSEAV